MRFATLYGTLRKITPYAVHPLGKPCTEQDNQTVAPIWGFSTTSFAYMDKASKTEFLAAVDAMLRPLGFKHRKSHQDWRKKEDASNEVWIHLNFGLTVINPSYGVRYSDLVNSLPQEFGITPSVSHTLSADSGTLYSAQTPPNILAKDILHYGMVAISNLLNRSTVIERLKSDKATDWPVYSASARMRLLPILLAAQGSVDEALGWIKHFETNERHLDQNIPAYSDFAAMFRSKYVG